MGALACDGLVVRYGEFTAVDGVSLEATPGEILGLLGPNGAGKTSVIRALTTIVPIAGGSASVGGHDLGDPARVRANIGVLPESSGYPGAQTGRSYLRFYGQLFGMHRSEADRRAETLLKKLGLGDRHGRIATYSRGMRQRLGLCRALMNSPRVLFLDEPTLGLDPAGQHDILRHLASIAVEDGACVVLCSHLLDEIERVCDRVAIMQAGRIIADGTVNQVITSVGVNPRYRVRVELNDTGVALAALQELSVVNSVQFDNSRPGDLDIDLALRTDAGNEVLRCLLDHGIPILSLERQGSRLSDAFIALTTPGAST